MEAIQRQRRRRIGILVGLAILLIVATFIALNFGRYSLSLADVRQTFHLLLRGQAATIPREHYLVIANIRLPRLSANICIGAALAVSGATFQALFENPMASPNVLGVNHGASLGAALAIISYASNQVTILAAFVMGLLAVGVTFAVSRLFRMQRTLALLLAGMVIGSLFQAALSYVKLIADVENALPEITYWLMGSFSSITWQRVNMILIPMLIGFVIIFGQAKALNLLTLGEEKAQTLGIHLRWTQGLLILAATLLTASSVAVTGMIGWVGLIVPHICRLIIGQDYRYLLPCSALFGAIFMVCIDTVARSWAQTEIPIGILTALIGAPIFFSLLIGGKGDGFNR